MDWQSIETSDNNTIKVPDRWLHPYYYEALNILFRFENALRIFVYVILKRELKEGWDLAAIADGTTIRTETKKRLAQAKEHGYLGYEVTSPMLYLNSGEILQILTSGAYWKHFARYFKASPAIVVTKLQEIGTVRNSLAHFRPLKNDDVDLIKQNCKHVLLGIETCLTQITSIADVVPSNSIERWYLDIKAIGGEHLTTALFSSEDKEWVRIELSYRVPTLFKDLFGDYFFMFKVANLRTPQILNLYKCIRENCIYVSELPIYGALSQDFTISNEKKVSLVFPLSRLQEDRDAIVNELMDIARKVEEETGLVSQDHVAQGELIEVKSGTATNREGQNKQMYWHVDLDGLKTSLADVDHVEFWGQRTHFDSDFIAATSQYPWMPSTVSKAGWF